MSNKFIPKLGDKESSEKLLQDLYLSLREKVIFWSKITNQTPQARMGYIGQHLVSVVTGIPGGKSGARGFDLTLPNGAQSEIKTCYRVDQLSTCTCGTKVSSVETKCSECGNENFWRNDDSKWLLGVKTDQDFKQVLSPVSYYLVLFEFEDSQDLKNQNIISYIWEVDPSSKGFSYCMIDYKINTQSRSKSAAPFNLWPWSAKFYMMKPRLIYKSLIIGKEVKTEIFPNDTSLVGAHYTEFPSLTKFSKNKTLTVKALSKVARSQGLQPKRTKVDLLEQLESIRGVSLANDQLCDLLAEAVYRPLIEKHLQSKVPQEVLERMPEFNLI